MKEIKLSFLLMILFMSSMSYAQSSKLPKVEVNMKVLLISIEGYELAPLRYAGNDVAKLSTLFQTRFGATSRAIIDRPNNGKNYKQEMEKAITDWCNTLTEKDTCILYLAGHGIVGPDKRLYLPMVDFKKNNFNTAAIPMEWIRNKLAAANGKCKLILLDTCFSGTGRDLYTDFTFSNSEEMARTFNDLPKVATLASSRENQKSWLWTEQRHSLYTYWLIEGFRGNADQNGDMVLDLDELFHYLDKNVSWISSDDITMELQNPVLLNDAQIKEAFRLPLLAGTTEDLLENAASLIDLHLRRQASGIVIVPEFTTGKINENTIQPQYGSLPRSLSAQLQFKLANLSTKSRIKAYKVLNPNATLKLMNDNHLTSEDLGTEKTKYLHVKGEAEPVKYIVQGRLFYELKNSGLLEMQISVLDTQEQNVLCSVQSKALLSASEIGELGYSGTMNPSTNSICANENEYVDIPGSGLAKPNSIVAMGQMIQQASEPNPMKNSNLPFKVEIYVRPAGTKQTPVLRSGKVIKNEYYLPLNKGEEYQIHITNNADKEHFIRVLVDGMNTLSQPVKGYSKGMLVEAAPNGKNEVAPVVPLEKARAWIVPAKYTAKVNGFYDVNDNTPQQSSLYRFELGDADESLGARKNYTEKLGRITIGIYPPIQPAISRPVATKVQKREKTDIEIYKGKYIPAENPTVIYNLRYLSQEEYDKLKKTGFTNF